GSGGGRGCVRAERSDGRGDARDADVGRGGRRANGGGRGRGISRAHFQSWWAARLLPVDGARRSEWGGARDGAPAGSRAVSLCGGRRRGGTVTGGRAVSRGTVRSPGHAALVGGPAV